MATTLPTPANQNTAADSRKSTQLATGGSSKNVKLDIVRRDVARVEVVDTDFVMITKSGRKILIRDGALNAVTDEEFSVVFSDEEAVSGKVLFSESQSAWVEAVPLNWSDAAAADSASLVAAPVVAAGGGISYGVLVGAAVVAVAAGGGGGSSAPAPDNAAKAKEALQAIGTFAKNNTDSFPTASSSYVGTPPSRTTYETAGVKGVNDFNLASINDALATAAVTDLSVDSLSKLQALVDAYISILNAANGRVDVGATLPDADAYVLIGVTGFGADITTRAAKAKLLSDVIDRKQISDVDFVKEIQALADQVGAVIAAAQGGTLAKEQLEKLGIVGVTTENFGLVLKSIQGTPDDGSGVQTLDQLQNIVDTIGAAALKAISTFAEDNKDSQPTSNGNYVGTPPDFTTYGVAGVKGVDKQNVNAINDALATAFVNEEAVSTLPKLQTLVDAYNAVLSMANGQINATATLPTAQQYTLIGLTGLESKDPQDPQSQLLAAKVRLLGDVIDRKSFGDVDTIKELQSLLNNVAAVINAVNGTQLTKEQLDALGLNGVTPANLALVLAAIDQTSDDGTGVDTLSELQNLIDTINGGSDARSALDMLVKYAQDNGGVVPNEFNYITAGVTTSGGGKVTAKEAEAFNDALRTADVTGESINTLPKLQGLVDAYRKVFALADGIGNNADSTKDVTLAEYQRIGVSTNPLGNDTHRLLLLNDAVDAQSFEGVNTIDEINHLVRIASAVQDRATGLSTNLSVEDLTQLGVRGVTQDNLGNLINAIAQAGPGGSDSLQELQNLLYSSLSISFSAISEDSGFGPNDFITNDNLLIFTGITTADNNTKIRLTLKRDGQSDVVLEGDIKQGQWDVRNTVALANGDYTITAQLFDANTLILKTVPFAQHVVVNKQEAATNPLNNNTIAITAIIDDTGASDTDFKTSDTSLIFKGQSNAANGTHVAVEIDGALQWSEVQNGQWTLDNTGHILAAGSHSIKAYLTDAAGNAASTTATQTLLIDTAQLTLLSKTSGAIGSTSNLLLKFSSAVVGAQGGQIVITDLSQPATPWATISVTDTTQVSINGDTVTINPFLDLVKGKQYRATITSGAFKSTTGAAFDGLSANADWTFTAVDPSMTVEFAGNGIRFNDGINQSELASNTLEVVGQISSVNRSAVTNARITKIMFTSADGDGSFELTDGLPTVNTTTFQWTLTNNTRWTSQLKSGKTYTVAAQLEANIIDSAQNSSPITPVVAQSALAVLIDTKPPVLTSVICDKTFIKTGDIAEFTFTFDEDPKDTFNIDNGTSSLSDLIVAKVGGQDVGKFLSLVGTGNVRKALFRAADNVTFTSTASAPTVTVAANSFTDAAGNVGTIGAGVVLPNLNIDTQGPQVRSVAISGINSAGQEFTTGTLVVGDRVRVTIGFDEVTRVIGVPIFKINVGGVDKQTKYVRGSGSNTLVFEYTVALGDSDNAGGITASANGFELSFSGIQDAFGNEATSYSTPAVNAGANALTVLTTGSFTALEKIKKFAADNVDPGITDAQDTTSAIPTVKDYEDAGVTGVDGTNLSSINNALRTPVIGATQVDTAQKLQNLVSAYRLILAFADGDGSNHTNAENPDFLQYALIGVQGVDSVQASLLGDVIDFKQKQDVDTIPEIQDLANAVAAVINQSKNVAGLTLDQLKNKLNIQAATEDNFAAVKRAIAVATTSGVDTWQELNDVVNAAATKATNAFNLLKAFADANRESLPIINNGTYQGTVPTWSTYTDAGIASVAGISNDDLKNIINDALATHAVTSVQIDSFVKLQNLVNAYSTIVGLANGTGGTPIADLLGASGYNAIGVTGLEPNAALRDRKAQLLSSVIDRKTFDDINTVKEIQALADAVSAVMDKAAGVGTVSIAQLKLLGFDVPLDKLTDVNKAIDDTNNDGTEVDTYGEIDSIITGKLGLVDQAVRLIANFAGLNAISKPTPQGAFVYDGTAPTAQTYVNAGVTGPVSDDEAAAFNDALATNAVGFASVDTAQEIKDLVAAYRTVLATANGPDVLASNKPTLEQYGLLGVAGLVNSDLVVQASRVSLLNDVIDRKTVTDVDTVLEIQALVNIVTRVIQQANSIDGLTLDDLNKLGIQNVTPENFAAVLQAIRDTDNQGTGVDTYIELQDLVTGAKTKYDQALSFIKTYAKNRTDPTQLGTTAEQPTLDTYKNLGVTKVTVDNLKSINSALATASVTDVEVSSVLQVQNLVDAYDRILKAAGNQAIGDVINPNDYTLLGISGIGGNAAKIKLLSEVIDRKTTTTSIDTADKLQALASTVSAVVEAAGTGTGLINAQQLTDLGITGVTTDNFSKVLAAIQGTVDDGTGVDTVKELQDLVNGILGTQATALQAIKNFAEANTTSQPLTATGFEYVKDVFIPVAQTYIDAGITGTITSSDAASFNDALATFNITGSSVNDVPSLQALVDAYRKVFALADGPTNPTTTAALTVVEYKRLGVDIGNLESGGNTTNRLRLLNDIVDRKNASDVNTINEINQLVKITNAIQDKALGANSVYTLTAEDFAKLGVRGVGLGNIGSFLSAINTAGGDGSDSVSELQNLLFDSLRVNFTAISDDTGVSSSDFVTNDTTLTLRGTSTAVDGTKIRITLKRVNQSDINLEPVVLNGTWQADTGVLNDGDYSLSYQLYDGSTLLPKVSTFAQHVQIDTSAVTLPDGSPDPALNGKSITFTGISPDTGVQGDFKTSETKLKFSGSSNAAVGTNVGIRIDGGALIYTTVKVGGIWEVDNTAQTLSAGNHTVTAFLVDSAGNPLGLGASQTVTIDLSGLSLLNKTIGPIASSANLVLTFNAAVDAVAGKKISISNETDNTSFDVLVNSSAVAINGGTVTLTLSGSNKLVAGKNYHANIEAGAFVSKTGVNYDGLLNANDWQFRTVDPTTTISLGGAGVDASNGINADELSRLAISGLISSIGLSFVNDLKINKLSFVSTDGVGSFDLAANLLPSIANKQTWALTNDTSWTSLLQSGKTYTVVVELGSVISGVTQTSVISTNTPVLVDTKPPTNVAINVVAGDDIINANETTTAITGTAEAGTTVQLTLGGVTKNVTNTTGTWRYDLTASDIINMGEGSETLKVTATDSVGNSTVVTRDIQVLTGASSSLSAVTITPQGGTVVANTLNSTNTHMDFAATVTAGQATGGKAEFYVGTTLIGTDINIAAGDTSVSYSTSDGTPTNAELQQAIKAGGVVSVKLIDVAGNVITATGPTLTYDITASKVLNVAFTSATGAQNNTLNAGDTITATVTFDEAVLVNTTGAKPVLNLLAGTNTRTANYVAGSGTNQLTFTYTIVTGDDDLNGLSIAANALSFNGGSIQDNAGNPAVLTHALVIDNPSYKVDTQAPTLIVANPATSTDLIGVGKTSISGTSGNSPGETIYLDIRFDSAVYGLTSGSVDGVFLLGGSSLNATWSGNDGNTTRRLTYTVQAGQNGTVSVDEVVLKAAFEAGIKDAAGNAFVYNGNIPDVIITNPTVDTVSPNSPTINAFAIDNVLNASELSNAATNALTGTAEANATVNLKLGSVSKSVKANASGIWTYTLLDADISGANGIGQGLKTFTASASDAAGNTSAEVSTIVNIDTVLPILTITSNAPLPAVAPVKSGDSITLTFTFSEVPVGFSINDIQVATHDGTATGIPVGTLSNLIATTDLKVFTATFTPTLGLDIGSTSLVSVAKAGYTDAVGNIGLSDATSPNVRIDTLGPKVNTIDIVGTNNVNVNKTSSLGVGDKIKFTLNMSEDTALTAASNSTPAFSFNLGAVSKDAIYDGVASTSKQLVFFYTIARGDNANASVGSINAGSISALAASNGLKNIDSLKDAFGNLGKLDTPAASTNTLVVDTTFAALNILADAAAKNNAKDAVNLTGTSIVQDTYTNAGVSNVDANNVNAYNSALNSGAVGFNQADTTSEVQDIVNAYNTILKLTDSGVAAGTPATLQQYGLIGVTGFSTTTSAQEAQLLSDAIDRKAFADVDTVPEVQTLANAAVEVMKAAASTSKVGVTLTRDHLVTLGILRVTKENFDNVLTDLVNEPDDGSTVNSMIKLQAVVDRSVSLTTQKALDTIRLFAADNVASSNTGDFSFIYQGTPPTVNDFINAGVTGVTDGVSGNLESIKDALATSFIDGQKAGTKDDIQKVVNAYNAVFSLADGPSGNAGVLDISSLTNIGANVTGLTTGVNSTFKLKLLNSVLDTRNKGDVDTVQEINALSATTNAIIDAINNGRSSATDALITLDSLVKLGVASNILSEANMAGIRASIAAQTNVVNLDELDELRRLVTFYNRTPLSANLITDTGINTTDNRSSNPALSFVTKVAAAPNATVQVSTDGGVTYIKASDYTPPTTPGTYTVWVRQVSGEGDLGQASSFTFTYDNKSPDPIKLNTSATPSTDTVYYGNSDRGTSKNIALNIQAPTDDDIAIITLTIGGGTAGVDSLVYASGTEQLLLASTAANPAVVQLNLGGVLVNVQYRPNTQTFEFTSTSANKTFTQAQVQSIESGLGFKTTDTSTGTRSLTFSHTDVAGNTNALNNAVVTVNIDNSPPSKVDFTNTTQQNSSYYNASQNLGNAVAIAPSLRANSDTDIVQIVLTMIGVVGTTDRLVFGDGASPTTLGLSSGDASGPVGGITIGGVNAVLWRFDSTAKTMTFTLNNNGLFDGASAQKVETALKFQISASATSVAQTSRQFTFDHVDRGGLSTRSTNNGATQTIVVDTVVPGDIDVSPTTGVQNTFVVGYGSSDKNTNKSLLSSVRTSVGDADVTTLVITAGGLTGSEVLTLQDTLSPQTIALSSSSPSGSGVTVGGVSVNWSYSGLDKKLSITKSNGSLFTSAEITAIENAIAFKETTGTAGQRTFAFTHLDQAGNNSKTSTVTVDVDYTNPSDIDLDSVTTGVQIAQTSYYNASSTGSMPIAPKMALASGAASDRYSAITITIAGKDIDVGKDKLIYGNEFLTTTNTLLQQGTLSGGTVAYTFNGSTLTLKPIKDDGSGWTAAEVQNIERNVAFIPDASTKQGVRTFTFSRTDVAGNVSNTATQTIIRDTILPSVFDLNTDTTTVDNTITQSLNKAQLASNATVLIAPKMGLVSADTDIKFFSMLFDGSKFDLANDTLTVNGATIALNVGDVSAAGQTIAGVSNLNWDYFSSGAVKVLVFSKRDQSSFTAADVKAIGQVLGFSTTSSSTTTAGNERTFSFSLTDQAGNKSADTPSSKISIDNVAPVIAVASSTTNLDQTSATPTTGIALASSGTVVEAGGIGSIQLKVRGLRSGSGEKLVVNGATIATEIDASGSVTNGSFTLATAGGTWSWRYNNATNTFNFSAPGPSNNVTASQAQAFLNSLTYKTTAATVDDVRQFAFTATDVAGNISNEAVSKVGVSTQTPNKSALNAITVLDGNNDGFKGDQFVITFNEPVNVSGLTNTAGWSLLSGNGTTTSLAGATVRAVDSVSFNGQNYATNFWVTLGVGSNVFVGQEQTLTLTASGNSASNSYVKLPTFTLTSQAITLEAWVYANYTPSWPTTGTGFQRIFDLGTNTGILQGAAPGTNLWLGFSGTSGKLQFQYFNNAPANPIATANLVADTAFTLLTWQHVAAVYSGTTMEVFVNGVSVKQVTGVGAMAASNAFNNPFIGKSNFAADSGFNGSIFDARIYSSARTATEIGNDFKGAVDVNDAKMIMRYEFNGNLNNTASAATKQGVTLNNDVATAVNTPTFLQTAGASLVIPTASVADVANNLSNGSVTFQLFNNTRTAGTALGNNLLGTTGNDFIAGQTGDDVLTGGTGADTFAWLLGDTGSDVVTDFKAGEGDMLNLSGILSGRNLGPNSTAAELANYLQLSVSGNDATLRIDPTGLKNFAASTTQAIGFTNGALNGLDDTVLNLVKNKTINLGAETSTPLVLDLDGNGIRTTSVKDGVAFDIDGYGQQVQTGWTDGKDGLLVLDLNQDGSINNGSELFGNATQLAGGSRAKDGFEALRQYDANKDGVIDAKDAVFAKLKVWVDINHDGVSAPQELHTLTDLGVQALALSATPSTAMDNGNALMLASTWQSVDGRSHAFVDVNFTTTYLDGHAVL